MTNTLTDNQIRDMAEALTGTCASLDSLLEDHDLTFEDLTTEQCQQIDEIAMVCEECGWWCETSEMDDNQVCEDCRCI